MIGSIPAGCGQCMPCRINRQRLWKHRLILESYKHAESSFVTLTYAPEHEPALRSLNPSDTQKWLKRLRERIAPTKVRFYLAGEYGDQTERPHYHAALFGYPPCLYGQSRYNQRLTNCCPNCDLIRDTWGKGNIMLGTLTPQSAGYICGYVTKKMTAKDDPRLNGRHPEFCRMSRRPGIAAGAIEELSELVFSQYGRDEILKTGQLPSVLRHGSSLMPLGRYLRKKLAEAIGTNEKFDDSSKEDFQKQMQALWLDAQDDETLSPEEKLTLKSVLLRKNKQKVASLEAKQKIYNSKGDL